MDEAQVIKLLAEALETLPPEAAGLRPVLETLLREHRRLSNQVSRISRIGDRSQEQLRVLNQELTRANERLSQALTEVRTLQGFIPICARCKRVRDDHGYWDQVEDYVSRHSGMVFSHGVCPECARMLFPAVPAAQAAGGAEPAPAGQSGAGPREAVELEQRLQALELDPTYRDNPLRPELKDLAGRHLRLLRRLGKISRISDGFQRQLKEVNLALTEASYTDLLTGLPNRRAMVERITSELDRSARGHSRAALLLADVDHFKQVNDTYGHEVGDQVLQGLAAAFRATLRGYDTCARWGGEEFLVLLPETDLEAALGVADKLRTGVAATREALPAITISVGVAVAQEGETLTALIRRADDAMYAAKRQGRNRVQA
jgi:diguanylate cyclase (GGDEF)-like protein